MNTQEELAFYKKMCNCGVSFGQYENGDCFVVKTPTPTDDRDFFSDGAVISFCKFKSSEIALTFIKEFINWKWEEPEIKSPEINLSPEYSEDKIKFQVIFMYDIGFGIQEENLGKVSGISSRETADVIARKWFSNKYSNKSLEETNTYIKLIPIK